MTRWLMGLSIGVALLACSEETVWVEAPSPDGQPIVDKSCHAGGGPVVAHPDCEGPVSDTVFGDNNLPWHGLVCDDKVYTCNRCPFGDHDLVGSWRHVHGATEDPDTPLDDGYRERLSFDGNTWTQHSTGYDIILEQEVTLDVAGWYFCGDKPEVPDKANVFYVDTVSFEGGFGWESGLAFSADPLKANLDQLLFRWQEGLNEGPYTDDLYCRIGANIKTVAGETKTCTDPF